MPPVPDRGDNPVAAFCFENRLDCFRGSLDNVLDRFYQAAINYKADVIVRLTGDCPLADPEIIDRAIALFMAGQYDYLSNTVERTFPIGLAVEVFSFKTLEAVWHDAILPSEKEHVTRFIYTHPADFNIGQFRNDSNLAHLRWTVDEPEDYEFVKAIYERLYASNPNFSMADILDLLKKEPQLSQINAGVDSQKGLNQSLMKDADYLRLVGEN